MQNKRCFGNGKDFYEQYHDEEWGVANHDDRYLFEMLILEGTQAGLSWETILRRRDAYKGLFYDFEPNKVTQMTDDNLEKLVKNPLIIRNRRKIFSTRQNAHIFIKIQKEFASFDRYLWQFVNDKPIINHPAIWKEVFSTSKESDALSKDLRKRGMAFVGSTIMYAYMQAVGLINDHLINCPFRRK